MCTRNFPSLYIRSERDFTEKFTPFVERLAFFNRDGEIIVRKDVARAYAVQLSVKTHTHRRGERERSN